MNNEELVILTDSKKLSMKQRVIKTLGKLLPIVIFIFFWECISYLKIVESHLLPAPHEIIVELFSSHSAQVFKMGYVQTESSWYLLKAISSSLLRVLIGITIGFGVGFFLGVVLAMIPRVKSAVYPIIRMFAPISPIAWIPIAMIMLGIGNKPAVLIVFLSVVFLVTVATVSSIQNIDPILYMTARTLNARSWKMLFQVIIPSALPSSYAVLRINVFAAWMSVLAAEMVGVSDGLGAMVMVGRSLFNMKLILGSMFLIGLAGYLLDVILTTIERHLIWWRDDINFM